MAQVGINNLNTDDGFETILLKIQKWLGEGSGCVI